MGAFWRRTMHIEERLNVLSLSRNKQAQELCLNSYVKHFQTAPSKHTVLLRQCCCEALWYVNRIYGVL